MKLPRKYASGAAFRVALEDRLKRIARDESLDLQRVRRQAALDRLLCQLFARRDAPWLLKGGYAMERSFLRSKVLISTVKFLDLSNQQSNSDDLLRRLLTTRLRARRRQDRSTAHPH